MLCELLGPKPVGQIAFSSHTEGDGKTIFDHACAMGLEGLVCKLKDRPYRSGKSEAWLKVKCVKRGTFTIVGFIPDRESIASLHLARRDGSGLVYVGKVGTGFSRKTAHDLRQQLQPLVTPKAVVKPPTTLPRRPERIRAFPS